MKKKREINEETCETRAVTVAAYIYMVLPFLIFAAGWFRIRFWVPAAAAIVFSIWRAWQDTPACWRPRFTRDNVIKILFICVVLAVWVFYSGIGFHAYQNKDHYARNSIFEVLVEYQWPIYNRDIIPGIYPEGTTMTSLIYYIGFWLPAAVVGKLFGLWAGYTFQMVWALLGLLLIYYYICARKRKLMVWPLLLLIFFSGLDILGMYLTGVDISGMENGMHLEWWMQPYQYSSMTTQLFWVFNQSLPAWLCTVFAMQLTDNRSIVFVISAVMLNATFPFVGLLALAVFWMLSRKYEIPQNVCFRKKATCWICAFVKDSCSIQNILGGGMIGIFSYLYLHGNTAAAGIASQKAGNILAAVNWQRYLVFVAMEAGIYLVLIYKYKKDEGLYYAVLLSLVLIPILKGGSGDFCMRASIPALFLLMLFVQDTLEKAHKSRDWLLFFGLCAALCLGSVTPVHEIARTVQQTIVCQNNGNAYGTIAPKRDILNGANFSGSVEGNLFFKYIAKKP